MTTAIVITFFVGVFVGYFARQLALMMS